MQDRGGDQHEREQQSLPRRLQHHLHPEAPRRRHRQHLGEGTPWGGGTGTGIDRCVPGVDQVCTRCRQMSTRYTPSANLVCTWCRQVCTSLHGINYLCTRCRQVCTSCVPGVYQLCTRCVPAVYQVCVYQMCTRCVPGVLTCPVALQVSKISLVDLAGSERADSTGAKGTRLKVMTHNALLLIQT